MTKNSAEKKTRNIEDSKLFAFLATFLSIVGFIIAFIARKDNKYVMFYAKQSLVIFISAVVVMVFNSIFLLIPILGWIIKSVLNGFLIIAWLLSWIFALSGEMKEVPVIKEFARKI